MVKFVAKQAVDTSALDQLQFLLDITSVSFDDRASDGFTVELGDIRAEVEGSGFTYVGGKPLPVGTITKVEVFDSGDLAYRLTDLNVKMSKLIGVSDVEELARDIFSGDDVLKGSSDDDTLAGGNGNDQISGKDGDDTLYGDNGKDLLDGGNGSDELNGGSGKDSYLFKNAPGSGVDEIVSFQSGELIQLKAKFFAGLSKGPLASDQFVEGTEAQDGNDHIIYDSSTGALYHDADGVGGAAQTQFAEMQTGLTNFGAGNIIVV